MIFIFAAPSGAGKTTLVNYLLSEFPNLEFSISATTRPPRGKEQNGREYYFVSEERFKEMISKDELLEWENVYKGVYYGTPRSEIERIERNGHHIVFDIDVFGALHLKRLFGDKAHTFFIAPPSIEELHRRLVARGTDSVEKIIERLAKAQTELDEQIHFDTIIVNDDLTVAKEQIRSQVKKLLL